MRIWIAQLGIEDEILFVIIIALNVSGFTILL